MRHLLIIFGFVLASTMGLAQSPTGMPYCPDLDTPGTTIGEECIDATETTSYRWNGEAWVITQRVQTTGQDATQVKTYVTGQWTFIPKHRTSFKLADGAEANDTPINIRRKTSAGDWFKVIRLESDDIWTDSTNATMTTAAVDWDESGNQWIARYASADYAPSFLLHKPDGTWSWSFSRPSTTYAAGEAIRGITERITASETDAKGFQFTIKNVLRLVPAANPPACAAGGGDNGAIYINATTKRPCYCRDGSWLKFSDDTAC